MKKRISVVGAVIVRNGLVLCAQRGPGGTLAGLWEFPGGKIEAGESAEGALSREISEELKCTVDVGERVTVTTHEYDFGVVELTTFFSNLRNGEPVAGEHSRIEWLAPDQLTQLEWAPADVPAVELIQRKLI